MVSRSSLLSTDAVVVTGAAQGLGRGIALHLAGRCAGLILWDVLASPLEKTAEDCRARGARVLTRVVDIGEEKQIHTAVEAISAELGDVFGLVNNAGIFPRISVLNSTTELWEKVLRVNLLGYYLTARMLAPGMLRAGRGAIVNVGSTAAFRGHPQGAHYAASKAGVVSFTKTLALELAPTVRVNCVNPGLSDTAQPRIAMSEDDICEAIQNIPMGRIGQPDDVARVVGFFLGPDASFITGQSIGVNGGAWMMP
ncbi:SDR family NAD(P)-dependent oxidoreductase [Microvirga sp. VF16]|uniref:SDR family NAD(P)-dependent oxidoreductase n=1 Tax=Microvirga sp. VF16 TaxID=2807101 RepID=UPI001FEE6CB6|nr:SDR family NAD(P)-dependent oxidoreductase [Microvirga sp. VF16]